MVRRADVAGNEKPPGIVSNLRAQTPWSREAHVFPYPPSLPRLACSGQAEGAGAGEGQTAVGVGETTVEFGYLYWS